VRRVSMYRTPWVLLALFIAAPSLFALPDELAAIFDEVRLPMEVGLDFPLPWDGGVPYAPIPDETAGGMFFQGFHGSPMYAVGRVSLLDAVGFITYYLDTSQVGTDARYELFLYDPWMRYLASMVLAHRESMPGWVDGRSAGIERTLTAELSWEQGAVQVLQFDHRAVTFLDECGDDGCPDPVVTMDTPSMTIANDGSISGAGR
jgi:hypothetical protein